jgi:hypothetical protein
MTNLAPSATAAPSPRPRRAPGPRSCFCGSNSRRWSLRTQGRSLLEMPSSSAETTAVTPYLAPRENAPRSSPALLPSLPRNVGALFRPRDAASIATSGRGAACFSFRASALGESPRREGGVEARASPSSWGTRTPAQGRMPEAQRISSAEEACADARWREIRK